MNYEKLFEELNASGQTFKPTLGVHRIKVMQEPTECVFRRDDGSDVPQIKVMVQYKEQFKDWFVTKGTTTKSVYGQLMALGKYKGQLKGEGITLQVTSSTNKNGEKVNSYTILEAVEILPLLEKNKEEVVA